MATPQPNLTPPILITLPALTANRKLTNQLATLGNAAFTRSKSGNPEKWMIPSIRFPTAQSILDTVGDNGILAVILDESRTGGEDADFVVEVERQGEGGAKKMRRGRLVACTTAVPWAGGWGKEEKREEPGWEMKAVCVDGDARYLRRGLAVGVLGALEERLIQIERESMRRGDCGASEGESKGKKEEGVLTLWILAVECLNGVYWRKRGYEEVRKGTYSGIWGCKTSFEMVVLKKEVVFSVD